MYWDYERCEKYLAENPAKPLIQCEYAHAMGNLDGRIQGVLGADPPRTEISGRIHLGFRGPVAAKKGHNGVTVYGYGGDWNPTTPRTRTSATTA